AAASRRRRAAPRAHRGGACRRRGLPRAPRSVRGAPPLAPPRRPENRRSPRRRPAHRRRAPAAPPRRRSDRSRPPSRRPLLLLVVGLEIGARFEDHGDLPPLADLGQRAHETRAYAAGHLGLGDAVGLATTRELLGDSVDPFLA